MSDEAKATLATDEREEAERLDADFRREFEALIAGSESSGDQVALLLTGFQFPSIALSDKVFIMPVSFDQTRFVGPVKLSEVSFRDRTSFVDAHFCADAEFFQTEFHKGTFNSAQFDGHALFAEAAHGSLNSSNAHFGDGASFVETRIREALFGGTVFSGETTFWHVTFTDAGDFQFARFLAGAEFREVLFEQVSDFSAATFKGTTEFDRVVFKARAEFGGSTIEGRLEFSPSDASRCFEAGAEFSNVRLDPKGILSFERVDLSDASFLWTNLESVVFKDVKWRVAERKLGPFPFKRLTLADESEAERERPDYAALSLNYRQLVRNYEAQRDYDIAESFYVGEMEVRRKQLGAGSRGLAGFVRRWLNGHALYLVLSRYGSSYFQSVTVLVLLVAVVALVFLGVGFRATPEATSGIATGPATAAVSPAPSNRIIQYTLWPDQQHPIAAKPPELLRDYGQALVFASSIATLQRIRLYEPINSLGWLWVNVASIMLVGQTALILLAIRRTFKR